MTYLSYDNCIAHCKEITREYATSFYMASKFLFKEKREATYAIYAFCRVSDNIVDQQREDSEKELEIWKSKLEAAFNIGFSKDPVLNAFVNTCKKYRIKKELAFELIDGLKMDLKKRVYTRYAELEKYCYKVASVPGLMLLPVLGANENQAKESAIKLGKAMQLTNILRDIKEDSDDGKIYLPEKDMEKFGYDRRSLENRICDNRFRKLMEFQIKRAESLYKESLEGLRYIPADARFCIILCISFYSSILNEIRKSGYAVYRKRVFVPFWKKILLLFKAPFSMDVAI